MAFMVIGIILLVFSSVCVGDMLIELRNGQIKRVAVNKKDIVSITFEKRPQGAHTPNQWGGVSNLQLDTSFTMDFETGNLRGWRSEGDAFKHQPTFGDNPTARRRGQPSNHQGNYWIGGYERCPNPSSPPGKVQGDRPTGILTSPSFLINYPHISFLIGGGCDMNTVRVELVVNGNVIMRETGKCTETMRRIRWNVSRLIGQNAQIRIIDNSRGGWGHINFDDLRFE